jgi:hypothetical protein
VRRAADPANLHDRDRCARESMNAGVFTLERTRN